MSLLLTLLFITIALTAMFWAMSLVLQEYFYGQAADRLPLRVVTGALLVACFLTFWTYVNTRASHKDKYGTLFDFNPTAFRELEEFDAIRELREKDETGKPLTATVKFVWRNDGKNPRFVEKETGADFKLNTSEYMTIAMDLDEAGKQSRFIAERDGENYRAGDERRFVEKDGNRYIDGKNPRLMFSPSGGALIGALLLNVIHFVIWFAAFWPILRYGVGHALLLMAVFGTTFMLMIVPLLFASNVPKHL